MMNAFVRPFVPVMTMQTFIHMVPCLLNAMSSDRLSQVSGNEPAKAVPNCS